MGGWIAQAENQDIVHFANENDHHSKSLLLQITYFSISNNYPHRLYILYQYSILSIV